MNNNHTDITIVLDRSGSMASVADDTIGGFNRFLKDQKSASGSATLTLHQFDHAFETPIKGVDVKSAAELTSATFVPRGSTALLDAIGRAIVETGERLKNTPDKDRAGKVIFVIITDGEENASREYNRPKVMDMISHQRDVYKWEFVFLGANQDAIKVGSTIGIVAANAMTYAANKEGTTSAFDSLAKNARMYRSSEKATMCYDPEDREAQLKAGVK